jgi:iron(III) transport system substrate-binding protein
MAGLAVVAALAAPRVQAADATLIDAAKKEGEVVWYTTLLINQLGGPLADAFQKKYGIKVLATRNDPGETALRLVNENRAGNMQADVFDGSFAPAPLVREGVLAKYQPESAKDFPKILLDPAGYWTAYRLQFTTPGVNTNLVPPGTEPKSWTDLLAPQWKGKMAWGINPGVTGAVGFIGLVLNQMGDEKGMTFLRELQKQNITGLKISARAVLDQVIAGEYPMALGILNDNAVISRNQGAPVAWLPMSPALGTIGIISVMEKARHPNAGRLLVDFVVSEEGQTIARDRDYIPVHPKVAPRDRDVRPDGGKFRAETLTPDQIDAGAPKWVDVFNDIFR